jgi:hypothetical protein
LHLPPGKNRSRRRQPHRRHAEDHHR